MSTRGISAVQHFTLDQTATGLRSLLPTFFTKGVEETAELIAEAGGAAEIAASSREAREREPPRLRGGAAS